MCGRHVYICALHDEVSEGLGDGWQSIWGKGVDVNGLKVFHHQIFTTCLCLYKA